MSLNCNSRNDKICPDCGGRSRLFPVNTNASNNVGGDFNILESCDDVMHCGYERYLTLDLKPKEISYKRERPKFLSDKFSLDKIKIINGKFGCGNPDEPVTWVRVKTD